MDFFQFVSMNKWFKELCLHFYLPQTSYKDPCANWVCEKLPVTLEQNGGFPGYSSFLHY